jgi:hypothetical protein
MSEANSITPAHGGQEPIVGGANPTTANHWFALAGRLDRASKTSLPTAHEAGALTLAKWPFLLGDAILLVAAYLIYGLNAPQMGFWQMSLALLCVATGAGLSITPYLVEYWVASRRVDMRGPSLAVEQLRILESAAAQITAATARWESAQPETSKTTTAANSTTEGKRDAEAQGSTESTPRTKASGLPTPPIEVEHLRQQESDWVQALVRMLDHVYALQQGALQSGQPTLIEQISTFQDACREVAKHVELRPFVAEPDEEFDRQRHQLCESEGPVPSRAIVAETIATGYTFRGRLLRPASVLLAKSPAEVVGAESQMDQRPAA